MPIRERAQRRVEIRRTLARETGKRAGSSAGAVHTMTSPTDVAHGYAAAAADPATGRSGDASVAVCLAIHEPAIRGGIELRHPAQKRHHRPHFIVALLHGPRRHAGELDAVLDDREQLLRRPSRESCSVSSGGGGVIAAITGGTLRPGPPWHGRQPSRSGRLL